METGHIMFSGTEVALKYYLERQDWDFRTKCKVCLFSTVFILLNTGSTK